MKQIYSASAKRMSYSLLLSTVLFLSCTIRSAAQSETAQINSYQTLLMSFSGEVVENTVQLNWVMENETNSNYFVIERSGNGSSFDSIAVVSGLNNAHESDYSFTDMNALNGANYYRLRQVSLDGISKYSKVICLTNNAVINTNLRIFPNPAVATINYTINISVADQVNVQIYNLAGVEVSQQEQQLTAGLNQQSVVIASLRTGDYILKISNRQGTVRYAQMFAKM
jgi:type IX secretion system substrate protein